MKNCRLNTPELLDSKMAGDIHCTQILGDINEEKHFKLHM